MMSFDKKKYYRVYNEINRDKIKEQGHKYYLSHRLEKKQYGEKYRKNNKDKVSLRHKKYQKEHLAERKIYMEKYKILHKNDLSKYRNDYYEKNKKRLYEQGRKYIQKRRRVDPLFNLGVVIRCSIFNCFKRKKLIKNSKTEKIIGCSFIDLKKWIERQFDKRMSWNNYGIYWEIDHIVPIRFAKNRLELIKLNNYKNLRPLEKKLNRIKNGKLPDNYKFELTKLNWVEG